MVSEKTGDGALWNLTTPEIGNGFGKDQKVYVRGNDGDWDLTGDLGREERDSDGSISIDGYDEDADLSDGDGKKLLLRYAGKDESQATDEDIKGIDEKAFLDWLAEDRAMQDRARKWICDNADAGDIEGDGRPEPDPDRAWNERPFESDLKESTADSLYDRAAAAIQHSHTFASASGKSDFYAIGWQMAKEKLPFEAILTALSIALPRDEFRRADMNPDTYYYKEAKSGWLAAGGSEREAKELERAAKRGRKAESMSEAAEEADPFDCF